MKKTFKLTAPNKTPERQTDSVKFEIRKYIARERRKILPEGVDFWDFDCKMGDSPDNAIPIHVSEINKKIDGVVQEKKETFYLEVLAKPGRRIRKPKEE
ncbi:MAG: hypothetical protein BroJett040_21400 [Oligoflexia bacterium]|nr:MAG: hypothetical protein BroJett040_21400 [Oligoflexia bacterium]